MREGTEPPEAAPPAVEPSPAGEPSPSPGEPVAPLEPVTVSPEPARDGGSIGRSIALGVVAFAATIVLLAGLSGLLTRSQGGAAEPTATAAPSVASGSAAPSSAPSSSVGAVVS